MGASEPPKGHFLGWTPGNTAQRGTAERTWLLPGGCDFVLQVHLPASDTAVRLDPLVGIYFGDAGPTEILSRIVLADETLDIPAGATDYLASDDLVIPVAVDVLAAYPHAHFLGKSMEITAQLPDGSVRSLLEIDHWDFGKQVEYRFSDPIELPAGSRVVMLYHYDNSAANPLNRHDPPERVTFGLQSTDEMATLMLQVRLENQDDVFQLTEAQARHTLQYAPRNWRASYELAASLMYQGRPVEAIPLLRAAVEARPDRADAWSDLGVALAQTGQITEAVAAWQRVLVIDQDDVQAHTNLGVALAQMGRIAEAVAAWERALEIDPSNIQVHTYIGNALLSSNQAVSALEHYREVVQVTPDDPMIHARIGAALVRMDDIPGAIKAFERAVELAPDNEGLREALATLRSSR